MKFCLSPLIKDLYQLKSINPGLHSLRYLTIKINRCECHNFILGSSYKEIYSKGYFNQEQIKEIQNIVMEQLADNKYITEIVIELKKED